MRFAPLFAMVTAIAAALPAQAQNAPESADGRPQLVVAISIDQLSADIFAEYREHFTGGFARLLDGAVFPSGYQAQSATETCPGHSTILTGAFPSRSGIVGNRWFDMGVARDDVRVYCAEDHNAPGSSSSDYTVSVDHLLVPTLGDLMKAADSESIVVSLAGKDRSAVMLGGHHADHVFWPGDAGFTTYEGSAQPAALAAINADIAGRIAQPVAGIEGPEYCNALRREIPVGGGLGEGGFSVGLHDFPRFGSDAVGFVVSPEADAALLRFAEALVAEYGLGADDTTDLLAIGLSATDYIGHAYGTQGLEMCIQLARLDERLGAFFDRLDEAGIDFVAMLTADHGGLDLPERQREQGVPGAARIEAGFAELDAALAEEMGLEAPVLRFDGPFGDFYVDRSVPEDRRVELLDRAIARIAQHPQVYRVFARDEILAQPMPDAPPENWSVLDRVRANYHPDRSGDFIVVLDPRVTPISEPNQRYVATHGSVWDYDRRVPILFWWPGVEHVEQPLGVMTVDILPTLASLIDLDLGDLEIDGRCIDLMPGVAESNCP